MEIIVKTAKGWRHIQKAEFVTVETGTGCKGRFLRVNCDDDGWVIIEEPDIQFRISVREDGCVLMMTDRRCAKGHITEFLEAMEQRAKQLEQMTANSEENRVGLIANSKETA